MTQCKSCGSALQAGTRWCGLCHANTLTPSTGRLASPVKRLGAHLLDVAAPGFAFISMIGVAGVGAASGGETGFGLGVLLSLGLLVGYVVWAFRLFSRGTTPGKNLLGMRVVKEDGTPATFITMLIREWVGKPISALVFSLGFLWILFDREKQGWHDKLVSSYVVN